jgi:hypothetical protein
LTSAAAAAAAAGGAVLLQAFSITECLCEIFDNSIRAGASTISVDSQSAQQAVATIRCCDNGVSSSSSSKLPGVMDHRCTVQDAAADALTLNQQGSFPKLS